MFEQFGLMHLVTLVKGAGVTIIICIAATFFGSILGFILGFGATSKNKIVRATCRGYVNIIRGIPLMIILFFIYFAVPIFLDVNISKSLASVGGLALYAGAYIGEIVRGSISAIPKGQFEASDALGLRSIQQQIYIILPQAIRLMTPALVGFIISLIKDSSLVSVIGYIDLTRAGRTVGNLTMQPLLTFLCVGLFYFVICYSLSKVAQYSEKKLRYN